MSTRIQLPVANFSRDLRNASRATAAAAGMLAAGALIAGAVLVFDTQSLRADRERLIGQTAVLAAEAEAMRNLRSLEDPEPAAIAALRGRIAALNALDFEQAPAVTNVLAVLEELMPGAVALQNLDYDRIHGALELVAVSASSEDLTVFFDAASKSPAFKAVRLVDKKQAGATEDGTMQYQVRLSIIPAGGEPRA
jgi:hypothetical protein